MSWSPDAVGICVATLVVDPMAAGEAEVRAASQAAVAAGFTEASVWAHHLDAVDGTGLGIAVVEGVTAWANSDRSTAVAEAERFVAAAERHGASQLLAVCLEPALTDIEQARRNLDVLVAQARDIGAQVCVEFLPCTGIPDLATVWALVEPLGPAAGIVLDTWHWVRQPGGPAPDVLAGIPGDRIGYLQLSDVAAEASPDLMGEAMSARLLPGEGVVDFVDLLARLVAIDAAPFVATEVFNPALVADRGAIDAATAMRQAATRLLRPATADQQEGTPS